LLTHAEQSMQRLRRIARERDCDPAVRVEAERSAWTVMRELVEVLQRLGFLPTAPQQFEASVLHRQVEPPSTAALEAEAQRLRDVLIQSGAASSETLQQLDLLQDSLTRTAASEQLASLTKSLPAPSPTSEVEHGQSSDP
jgi:hypothetical protein